MWFSEGSQLLILLLISIFQCLPVCLSFTGEQVSNLLIHSKQYPLGDPFACVLEGPHLPQAQTQLAPLFSSPHSYMAIEYNLFHMLFLVWYVKLCSLFIISPIIYSLFKFLPLSVMFSANNKIFIHLLELLLFT